MVEPQNLHFYDFGISGLVFEPQNNFFIFETQEQFKQFKKTQSFSCKSVRVVNSGDRKPTPLLSAIYLSAHRRPLLRAPPPLSLLLPHASSCRGHAPWGLRTVPARSPHGLRTVFEHAVAPSSLVSTHAVLHWTLHLPTPAPTPHLLPLSRPPSLTHSGPRALSNVL